MPPILIIGKSGAGKDTVVDFIEETTAYKRIAFADPIKKFAHALEFDHDEVYGTQAQKASKNKYWNISFRRLAQKFGTEICREILPDIIPDMNMNSRQIWARVAEIKFQKNYGRVIISDGRFLDEAQLVKEYGGTIIKITRNNLNNSLNETEAKHTSELELDQIEYDYLIENNGTFKELYDKVYDILNKINNTTYDLDLNYDFPMNKASNKINNINNLDNLDNLDYIDNINIKQSKLRFPYMELITLVMTVLIPSLIIMNPPIKNLAYAMLAYIYSLKHSQLLSVFVSIIVLTEFTSYMCN